jgi:hypothetical protein
MYLGLHLKLMPHSIYHCQYRIKNTVNNHFHYITKNCYANYYIQWDKKLEVFQKI